MEQRLHLILTCQNYIVVSLTLQIRIIFALFFHITERNVNEFYSKYGNCVNLLKNVTISSVIHPIFFTFSLDFQKRSKSKFPHFIFYFTSAVMKKMLLRTIGEKKLSWKWQKFWSAKTWEVYIHLMNCLLQSSLLVGLVLLFDFFSTWIYWYIS